MRTATAEVITGKRGFASAKVVRADGSEILLHSLYDPVREADSLVPAAVAGEMLVFLGTGLGYHIPAAIARNPRVKRVVIIDFFREFAEYAASRIEDRSLDVEVVFSAGDGAVPQVLPFSLDGMQFQVIAHPPSISVDPAWYARHRSLLSIADLEGRPPAGLKSEKAEKTILVPYGAYFCESECIRGFEALGHRVVTLDYRRGGASVIDSLQDLLRAERPDMVFSVNCLGFDRAGVMADILAGLRIPLAVWFVDSPEFILYGEAMPPLETSRVFLWEPSYLPYVRKLGYRAAHLPLAADESLAGAAVVCDRFRTPLSFVGNSLAAGFLSRLAVKFPHTGETAALAERAMEAVLGRRGGQLELLDGMLDGVASLPEGSEERLFFRAYVLHSSTTIYRLSLLKRILPLGPAFFGDPDGWRKLFGHDISVHPDVNYYAETPSVYASSAINFNATSLQMPRSVNQRVFDVPLCGGFLLTDRQDDLFQLFDEGETATYEGVEDVAEKVRFYQSRPELRRKIALRARERVMKEHTYRHRMQRVVAEILGEG